MRATHSRSRCSSGLYSGAAVDVGLEGVVVSYAPQDGFNPESHECVTRMQIAEQLAALKGYEFAGEYDDTVRYPETLYYVPSRTLVGSEGSRLGIRNQDDLFGGVVPYPFVGTKTISHPLLYENAHIPEGWCRHFCVAVEDAVLGGHAAFTLENAERAGAKLLERGRVRVKPALALGGRGQIVVGAISELRAAILEIDPVELLSCGVVLEQNLENVKTYSVGQVHVARLTTSYVGTQSLTTDNEGAQVYGGSDLIAVRGDFEALLALDLGCDSRRVVQQARIYDHAANEHFPGFFASRRNYDIARGYDGDGRMCCGVLEQSWRLGGASSAEIAALEVFRADPEADTVRARCVEVYGRCEPPPDAMVYFCGIDEKVGYITKYTVVERHVDAR
jgi:hypothetical protein